MKKTISERFVKIRFDNESSGQRQLEVAELLCGAEKPKSGLTLFASGCYDIQESDSKQYWCWFEDGSSIQCSSPVNAESSLQIDVTVLVKCSR